MSNEMSGRAGNVVQADTITGGVAFAHDCVSHHAVYLQAVEALCSGVPLKEHGALITLAQLAHTSPGMERQVRQLMLYALVNHWLVLDRNRFGRDCVLAAIKADRHPHITERLCLLGKEVAALEHGLLGLFINRWSRTGR